MREVGRVTVRKDTFISVFKDDWNINTSYYHNFGLLFVTYFINDYKISNFGTKKFCNFFD